MPRARDFTIVVNRDGVFKRTTQYSLNYRLLRRNGWIGFPCYCCSRLQAIPLQTIITYTALGAHSTKGELLSVSLTRDILLKNSSHPEDLAAALPIVSRITPDGYGVQAQVLKQLILFTMMKKTMNGTCSKLKIEIIPKTHRVVRLEIIQQ